MRLRPGRIAIVLMASGVAAPTLGAQLIGNGSFDAETAPWWATGNLTPELRDGRLCAVVPGGLANPWDAIIGVNDLTLLEGESYRFAFFAAGDPKGPVRALVQMPVDPYTSYVSLTPTAQPEGAVSEATFVSPVSMADAQVVLQVGGAAADWTLCLDDVSLDGGAELAAYAPETGPSIRVNQLGYLPDGPKRATVINDAAEPLDFTVADAAGAVVFTGKTVSRGMDETAGAVVHVADFTALDAMGEGLTLSVGEETSYPFAISAGLYADLRIDALSYFYPVRSGIAIDGAIAGEAYARPAGHVNSPADGVHNKGDRDVPCQPAEVSQAVYGEPWTCDYTLSPTGGWYDAGDHGKYVVNGGISVAQLLATYERALLRNGPALSALGDGSLPVPEAGNGVPDILDEVRWELDFFAAMVVPEGEPMAGMVHHKVHDSEWTGLPLLPHLDEKVRELHRPSTAATLNAAATFAQASRLFAPHDAAYAATLYAHAVAAWQAALANPAIFAPAEDGDSGGGPYNDDNVDDEFFWAATELFLSGNETEHLDYLRASPLWGNDTMFTSQGFDWASTAPFALLELAAHPDKLPPADAEVVRSLLLGQADRLLALQSANPFGHAYAPASGLYDWGSNHLVLQNATILAAAHDLTGDAEYRAAAIESADYVLGRNALNLSYVTGYGTVFSQNQHSRWFAHQVNADLPHPPRGALAGGPNSSIQDPVAQGLFAAGGCAPQTCYVDDIESWSTNEITINWNAALAQLAWYLADQ
jgi:endoglucanase